MLVTAGALAIAPLAMTKFFGNAARMNSQQLAWVVARPLMNELGRENMFASLGVSPGPVSLALLSARALKIAPELVWSNAAEGAGVSLLAVHGAATVAAFLALRRRSPAGIRSVAAYGLTIFVTKFFFLLLFYEPPGFGARHLAAESVPLVIAAIAIAMTAHCTPRCSMVLAALACVFFLTIDYRVATARAVRKARLERYTATLASLVPSGPGAFAAFDGWGLAWKRPGLTVAMPPVTEVAVDFLAEQINLRRIVLDPTEPLVARRLAATGQPPQSLGRFRLVHVDRSLGVSLLVYDRAH
jgi:hypothetical protein